MNWEVMLFYWFGWFCIISLLILLLVFIQTQIYWYLQNSHGFWRITFLWLKSKKYYNQKEISLKSPNGKYYKVIEEDGKLKERTSSRIEIIEKGERKFVKWDCRIIESIQDEGRTIKFFIEKI